MRNFLLGFLSALLMVAAVGVFASIKAQEAWMVISGLAHHLDRGNHCNSVTSGMGYEAAKPTSTSTIGFYLNSNCAWSAYAGKVWMPLYLQVGDWRVRGGTMAALVSGYGALPLPATGGVLTIERGDYGLNVIGVPFSGGVLWLQAKVRWR